MHNCDQGFIRKDAWHTITQGEKILIQIRNSKTYPRHPYNLAPSCSIFKACSLPKSFIASCRCAVGQRSSWKTNREISCKVPSSNGALIGLWTFWNFSRKSSSASSGVGGRGMVGKKPSCPNRFFEPLCGTAPMAPAGKERVIDSNNSWIHDHEWWKDMSYITYSLCDMYHSSFGDYKSMVRHQSQSQSNHMKLKWLWVEFCIWRNLRSTSSSPVSLNIGLSNIGTRIDLAWQSGEVIRVPLVGCLPLPVGHMRCRQGLLSDPNLGKLP